jgi:hypothetical protein
MKDNNRDTQRKFYEWFMHNLHAGRASIPLHAGVFKLTRKGVYGE